MDGLNHHIRAIQLEKLLKDLQNTRMQRNKVYWRLPVPIGTTVYEFEPLNRGVKECTERTVIKYTMYNDSIWFNFADGFMKNIEDFGNTIFLTREEAEQKLKEMENNNKVMNFNDKQVTVAMVGNSEDTAVNLIHKVMNGKL